MTEAKKRAGKKAGKGEPEKSVEQLTDEKLTRVSGGIVNRQDRPCQPEQCAPPPPPPKREQCGPGPECAVVRAR
ncbi:MAG: hypothetical protein RIN56_10045 [Sporomusaceae bacterium]|nr:hypothetical protein [Sporomusaceae bacterium]